MIDDEKEKYFYDQEFYKTWIDIRLNAITEHYGIEFFKDKTLLEVGAAWGDGGNYFDKLGAKVTCTDYSKNNLKVINERYPNIITFEQDLSLPWPFDTYFDIIVHMGVFYHLPSDKATQSLKDACKWSKHLIFNTALIPESDDSLIVGGKIFDIPAPPQNDIWETDVIAQTRCNPTSKFIENILLNSNMIIEKVNIKKIHTIWFATKNDT